MEKVINEIKVPSYWEVGNGHFLLRSSLPWEHKESEYSYIKNTLNLIPEDFGVYKNYALFQELSKKSKEELIDEVINLHEHIYKMERSGF